MPTQHQLESSRSQAASKPMDASRRREMVCNLLTQIFELAERTRVSRHRATSGEESEPISLIELIQASYAVFERYGIGPPDDAVYHRYLLSLSINPDRDWRKKLVNFDLGAQPRVKRLCSALGHRHRASETQEREKLAPDSGVQKRQRSGNKQDLVRRASVISTDTGKANSGLIANAQRQQDQFGDMLSLDSPIQRLRSRKAFPKIANLKNSPNQGPERKIRVGPRPPGIKDETLLSTGKESAKRLQPGDRQLQMITTSIEQWRATQAVKQLVDQGKAQDAQTHKLTIVTRCTQAIFHWITQSLPEKLDFHATESPRALPLCIVRRISVDVEVFKKSARRIWLWQTKTLLRAWHRHAQRLKTFRLAFIY
ncbi:hypothetical protein V7S43_017942 [Phytophthora oleae]|uniref:Uncharacterized protein n=1 Tax=Phytophthora oleae TaxID=2107226 RepID=A0ABD3ERR0_9STRA